MKILYLIPGTGCPAEEMRRREARLNAVAAHGTQVTVQAIAQGPPAIESLLDEYSAIPQVLAELEKRRGEYDAFIIGCAGDAGLDCAREMFSCPVVGPGEASLLLGPLGGKRFSIVTTNSARAASKSKLVREAGLEQRRLVSSLGVDVPVLEMRKAPERTMQALIHACREAKGAGAEVMIIGCMSLAFLDPALLHRAEEESGMKIVNPVVAAVKLAEALVVMGRA